MNEQNRHSPGSMPHSLLSRWSAGGAKIDDRVWRRFAVTFLATFAVGLSLIYTALVAIDPFDTGRIPTFMPPGTPSDQQQVNSASRARDPKFNAAIFGNSHGQLLSP